MKLYVIVRNDIRPGLQIAQSCHALRLFSAEHPEVDQAWYTGSNNLVVLQVANKEALVKLAYDLTCKGANVSIFREPDLHDEPTALAVGPLGEKHLSTLPLALRGVVGASVPEVDHAGSFI
jgi:peptidyl-tRNA hydrolase